MLYKVSQYTICYNFILIIIIKIIMKKLFVTEYSVKKLERVKKINNRCVKLAMNFHICLKCDLYRHPPTIKTWRMMICKLLYKVPVRTMTKSDEESSYRLKNFFIFLIILFCKYFAQSIIYQRRTHNSQNFKCMRLYFSRFNLSNKRYYLF